MFHHQYQKQATRLTLTYSREKGRRYILFSKCLFSFDFLGMNGKNSQQFKDFPFIPIVTAPRVVLLVPDRLFKELDSRTQVLLRTIFNTWPMLVFIVVSAMMSGLIVWLLVSSYVFQRVEFTNASPFENHLQHVLLRTVFNTCSIFFDP